MEGKDMIHIFDQTTGCWLQNDNRTFANDYVSSATFLTTLFATEVAEKVQRRAANIDRFLVIMEDHGGVS